MMKFARRRFLEVAVSAVSPVGISRVALAQSYPFRPITMVVTSPAGGAMDALVRIITERMRVALQQPIVIENVSGANGRIGAGRVARAAPDGYPPAKSLRRQIPTLTGARWHAQTVLRAMNRAG